MSKLWAIMWKLWGGYRRLWWGHGNLWEIICTLWDGYVRHGGLAWRSHAQRRLVGRRLGAGLSAEFAAK